MTIRVARPGDAGALLEIYGPLVEETAISFETEVPSEVEFRRRIADILPYYPWLVSETDRVVTGYAYACRHRERTAYQWSAETSVYVRENFQRKGLAGALYEALFQVLRDQGFHNALAGIALPNPASVAFHESMGFELIGTYKRIGFKLGEWRDVAWYQRMLKPHGEAPSDPPITFSSVHTMDRTPPPTGLPSQE